jgi:hypothetical protein
MNRQLIAYLAVVASALTGLPAYAQDEWETQVRMILDRAGATAADAGMTASHEPYTGTLAQGESDNVTVSLDANTQLLDTGGLRH